MASRPVLMPKGDGDIRVHQEVACRVEPGRIDVEMGGPQLRADAHRAQSVTERAEKELVLAPHRPRTAAVAERGQLLPRERPPVRRAGFCRLEGQSPAERGCGRTEGPSWLQGDQDVHFAALDAP